MIDSERRLVTTLLDNFALAYSKIDGVSVDMFTDRDSRTLFCAILDMKEEGERIDSIAVANKAGMKLYELSEYTDQSFPSTDSVEHDCHVIVKAWQGREIINTLKIYSASTDEPDTLTDEVIEKLGNIINQTVGSISGFSADIDKWRKSYEDEFNGIVKSGVKCGYGFIDKVTNGFKPGNLVVIGARTGIGKTTFALNQAVNMAKSKIAVGVISMEMTQNELIDKILGIRANVKQEDIHSKRDSATFSKIMGETSKIEGLPIFLNAPRSDDPNKIFNIIKQMVYKRGVKCVFLDYLQLMSYPQQSQNRNYEIGKMTRKLKMLAGEVGIPIVVLSQLKRRDGNPTPTLNDLRDSGSIEQDANIVLFLHQESEDQEENPEVDIDCIIAKNRGGGKGFRSLYFRKQISLISAREGF
jgi:replicative DNA helicase